MRVRFVPLLALTLATASALPASAQEAAGERPAEKAAEKAVEKAEKAEKAEKTGEQADLGGEGHYPPFSTRFKLLAIGLGITGVAWGISYAAARGWPEQTCVQGVMFPIYPNTATPANPLGTPCSSGPPGSNQLGIPIVGPWIALGKSGCASDEPGCSKVRPVLRGVGYVVDGVVQLAGIGLVVQAIAMKTESTESAKKSAGLTFRYRGVEVTPVPMAAPGATGLSLVGSF